MTASLAEYWPPFGLRVACGPVVLRFPTDDDLAALVDVVQGGVRPPGVVPFLVDWDELPEPKRTHNFLQYHWSLRADMKPESWKLELLVERDGVPVGMQGFHTQDYLVTHTGESGSWLGRDHQGKGTGTLMRQALATLLFDHLDAVEVTSAAFTDNARSLAVSKKVGYRENGVSRVKRGDGSLGREVGLVLTPEDFVRPPHEVTVEGADAFAEYVGISRDTGGAGS